jgi:SAM-dependent methyltransferase
MPEHKDYFSGQAHARLYATFRPAYPENLYRFIFAHLNGRTTAWDCATGNGQVAEYLSNHFNQVYATDISQQQIANAYQAHNIAYTVAPAEKTSFPDHQFDLITVAQAMHWFNADAFYPEAKRVLKPNGLLAVWGYARCKVTDPVDTIYLDFYRNTVGPYWDDARRLVEDEYRSIPFPFKKIDAPAFSIKVMWTLDQYTGYLSTWSATQKFIKEKGFDPVPNLIPRLAQHWPANEQKEVRFPVFLKLGQPTP